MSVRTTVTLDDDVLERLKHESRSRGESFRSTLNDLLRIALVHREDKQRHIEIEPVPMGYKAGLDYDDIESLIERGEGEQHQ